MRPRGNPCVYPGGVTMTPLELALYRTLNELVTRCDGEEGVRPDGSNIDTLAAHVALCYAELKEAPDDVEPPPDCF